MDRLVWVFQGGTIQSNGEFENMNEDLEIFDEPPSFEHLVNRVTSKYGCRVDEVEMRGRFDCGKARSHYVPIKLTSEAHWKQYKEVVE